MTRSVLPLLGAALLLAAATPLAAQTRVRFDVRTPMRDGVELSSDVWLPEAPGRYPTILMRTPYMKTDAEVERAPHWGQLFTKAGYVFVMQDVRGRGDSDGDFGFFFQEGEDGFDAIEWIARQEWSDGRVGMIGSSYLGTVQWLAANERPPHLECMIPTASGGDFFNEIPYRGGAFVMSWAINWINGTSGRIGQSNTRGIDMDRVYAHRPLLTMDEALGRRMPLYRAMLEHDTVDEWWRRIYFDAEDFRRIDLPALHVTGWFDGDQPGALYLWRGMRAHSPAADAQHLVIGPWDHGQTFTGGALELGELEFGPASVVDLDALYLDWFEDCFAGDVGSDRPRARVWLTGSNRWLEADAYPPANVEERALYLRSGGRANTLVGDGALSWTAPGDEPPDSYAYDPADPAPNGVGAPAPADGRAIQRRDDVLVYTGDVLTAPVTVLGKVLLELHASSDGRDTDFIARLTDVHPDGRAVVVGPTLGAIRARYRNGFDRTELLTPGRPTELTIDLHDVGHTFLPGHRIRVEVTSSAYPAIHPNPNTGNPIATDTESRIAQQRVYHDAERPSRLLLPVLPNPP